MVKKMTLIGKYTVAREHKLKRKQETQDWAVTNERFVSEGVWLSIQN